MGFLSDMLRASINLSARFDKSSFIVVSTIVLVILRKINEEKYLKKNISFKYEQTKLCHIYGTKTSKVIKQCVGRVQLQSFL